ncbi:serine/threonine protein kinase [Sphaerospermopsis torques-reginae]|uniref:non-specific serine/threonine protein kinase n=1 Tax=Sphaerospermopsis torques-reginae ITEP-024 TaxID=984208 RepID=A0ABX8WZ85_9CYAN|nr:serine/threonine-protein kinase [Sphaerospermopsis torques-reginae]QYX31787.1 serine/threonine protein kinase [Sphaerospermopsis torques-reginae ITEP-024]
MSIYPDFQAQGYQVIKELGRNREGGRITWLVTNINTGQQEVIKQFCFAQAGSNWSSFAAHEREIQVLTGLKHPGIPCYLNSFPTSDGFCLVQQYIDASTLAEPRSFSPEEIKQIAVKVLEILVYLQNRIPSVIHRDIKPENILVDEHINVYLIDFGFARIGSQEVAGSSVFKGTPGFIPPEQMFKPTEATDLYALGATLICLLTGIKSTEIDKLQDEDDPYLLKFRHLLPRLSLRFLDWLEKMVQPKQKDRFSNAELALQALKPLDVIRIPIVTISQTLLEFKAQKLGEKINQLITIKNSVPDTLLEGRWEVAPHPSDPPHTPDSHAWISVQPAKFKRNNIDFRIQIDTKNLMAQKNYKRQLILYSNSYPESHILTVKVQTEDLPIEKRKINYRDLIGLLIAAVISFTAMICSIPYLTIESFLLSLTCGFWLFLSFFLVYRENRKVGYLAVVWAVAVVMAVGYLAVVWAVAGAVIGAVIGAVDSFTIVLMLLLLGFGITVGTGIIIGFLNPFILLALTGTGLPALSMLLYPPLKRRKLIAKYRQSEESLIKP